MSMGEQESLFGEPEGGDTRKGASSNSGEGSPTLGDATFCAFDVETTGLSAFSRLVEIGAVRFRLGGEAEEFSTLVDPGQPIPEEATLVHGIDDDAVAGAPDASKAITEFLNFSEGCLLVAHNASFDVGIISIEAARAGLGLPDKPVLDSISMARSFLPPQPDYSLATLAAFLGLDVSEMHRSLPDARATRAVVEATLTSLSGWREMSWSFLAGDRRTMRFSDFAVSDAELPLGLDLLGRALERGEPVRIIYDGGTKGPAPRLITPLGVLARKGVVYLEAHCHADGVNKNYRLDRIRGVEPA